jgi:hypothetical protein
MFRSKSVALSLAAALAAGALASCATPTLYAPADARGYGYREQRVESDRFIVTFAGNAATNSEAVADAALRRAADLTIAEGYDWFEVVSRNDSMGGGRGSGTGVSVGVGGVAGGGRSSVGTSVGLSFPLGGNSGGGASTTALEIRMGHGERPDRVTAYDAQAVARNLAGALAGP